MNLSLEKQPFCDKCSDFIIISSHDIVQKVPLLNSQLAKWIQVASWLVVANLPLSP